MIRLTREAKEYLYVAIAVIIVVFLLFIVANIFE
jgi:hypothetical protein